jgi:inorganic triphosphatase YgiF
MNEFELKFQVPRERAAAVADALQRGAVQRTRLRARYFDTPDHALARHGLVLRVRQEGREHVQTAKGPGKRGFDRLEHNVPLEAGDGPDPSRHDGHPVGKAMHKALGGGGAAALQPLFETDVIRRSRVLQAAGTAVEIALDEGRIRAGGASVPLLELEFELKDGSRAALVELAQRWCEEHGLWLDPLSKSALGQRLADGAGMPPPIGAREIAAAGSRGELLAAILDAGLQQVLANAREIAAGTGSDAHIHQSRVGLRRLRSAVRELSDWSPLLAAAAAEVEEPLRAAFHVLGAHRDRATLLPALTNDLAAAGAPLSGWAATLPDVAAAVRDATFQNALLRLVGLVQELSASADGGLKAARRSASQRLQQLHDKELRAGRHFMRLPQVERHAVRKRLKHLRYLAELVRPLFAGHAVDRYVAQLKGLQDALGRYQDMAAGRQLFEQHAAEDARAWFAAGWLAARGEELARDCERACRAARREARPFWD